MGVQPAAVECTLGRKATANVDINYSVRPTEGEGKVSFKALHLLRLRLFKNNNMISLFKILCTCDELESNATITQSLWYVQHQAFVLRQDAAPGWAIP